MSYLAPLEWVQVWRVLATSCQGLKSQSTRTSFGIDRNTLNSRAIHTAVLCNGFDNKIVMGSINSLWPSGAKWRHRTSVQVKVCCPTAPTLNPNQYWLIISEVLWQSPERNFSEMLTIFIPDMSLKIFNLRVQLYSSGPMSWQATLMPVFGLYHPQCHRLLHSPSLMAVGLSVGDTLTPMDSESYAKYHRLAWPIGISIV